MNKPGEGSVWAAEGLKLHLLNLKRAKEVMLLQWNLS